MKIKDVKFLTATTTILADCDKQYVTIWMTATNAPVSPGSDQTAEPKVKKCIALVDANDRLLTAMIASRAREMRRMVLVHFRRHGRAAGPGLRPVPSGHNFDRATSR